MALQFPKIVKYVFAKGVNPWGGNLAGDYVPVLKQYFREHPLIDKVSRQTEYNINGDYSILINKIINGL